MSKEIDSHILRKYDIISLIGSGAYGFVWKATVRDTGQVVAIKKAFDAFHDCNDAIRILRETFVLNELRKHENIIQLVNIHRSENDKDLYMVFEFFDTDLQNAIKQKFLKEIHKQYISFQLIRTLYYIHSANIIHRDIKPPNIMLNRKCQMKLIDFGLARTMHSIDQNKSKLTDYIASRSYRAPEVLLGSNKYSKAVDMWAVGCIIAEMYTGKPIFQEATHKEQIQKIIEVTGSPTLEEVKNLESTTAESMLSGLNDLHFTSLKSIMLDAPLEAIDLVKLLLTFNHKIRITAEQALEHPYLKQFHNKLDEPKYESSIIKEVWEEGKSYTIRQYKDILYDYIKSIKKEREKQKNK